MNALWGLIGMTVALNAFGLGLGVPGPEDETNYYYQVEDTGLYRYICPPKVVPTKDTCPRKDPTFFLTYTVVRDFVKKELEARKDGIEKDVVAEIWALKEADPKVKKLKADIKGSVIKAGELETKVTNLKNEKIQFEADLKAVKDQLKLLVKKLVTDLTQDELLRTVEVHVKRTAQKAQFEAAILAKTKEVSDAEAEAEDLSEKTTAISLELGKYLPTLVVQSDKLIALEKEKVLVNAQIGLFPELDKRLTDPVAYPLDTWIESGIPGVKELTDNFLSRADCMTKGEINPRRSKGAQ